MNETLEQKQAFLRQHVLEAGIEPEVFLEHMSAVKNQGYNIELESWSIAELKEVVADFKRQSEEVMERLRDSQVDRQLRASIITDLVRQEKVYYEGTNLWDYQLREEQECAKYESLFKVPQNYAPFVQIQKFEVNQVGGLLFGIGSRNQLEMTISSNITNCKVVRKSQDCDWLREVLTKSNPGWWVPALSADRELSRADAKGIQARVSQIHQFLNKLPTYPVFMSSRYFREFLSQDCNKTWNEFKNQEGKFAIEKDIGAVETENGRFMVEISQKINHSIKNASQMSADFAGLYGQLNSCLQRVLLDMQSMVKNMKSLRSVTSRLSKAYDVIHKVLHQGHHSRTAKMFNMLDHSTSVIRTELKNHLAALRKLKADYVEASEKDWSEMGVNSRRLHHECKNYLNYKESLIRKKEKHHSDPSKWQIVSQDYENFKQQIKTRSKEDIFVHMFPRQNENQERMRLWLAFVNQNYLTSYKMFLSREGERMRSPMGKYAKEYLTCQSQVKKSYEAMQAAGFDMEGKDEQQQQ